MGQEGGANAGVEAISADEQGTGTGGGIGEVCCDCWESGLRRGVG